MFLRRNEGRSILVCPAICLLAFLLPWLGYDVLRGWQTADFRTRTNERTYLAFCQGENVLFAGRFLDTEATRQAGGENFGTVEENKGSVWRAIANHPQAFGKRLSLIPGNFLGSLVAAWGGIVFCIFGMAAGMASFFLVAHGPGNASWSSRWLSCLRWRSTR